MSKVDFAIIGVPKSATTFVHHALMSHPDVTLEEGENNAFARDGWEASIAQFLEKAAAQNRRLRGLKRPDMLFNSVVAERMKSHNPDIKAVAVLRHPIERVVAHYFHQMKYSFLPLLDFNTGIRELISGEMQSRWPRTHEVLNFSLYADAITRYADILGQAQLLILTHDDVKKSASDVLQNVCGFLNIDFDGKITMPAGKPQKVMYSLERLRYLRHGNEATMQLDEFDRAQKFRPTPLSELESAWVWMVRQFDEKVAAPQLPNVPPRLDSKTWEMLYAHFRDDIIRVESILGRAMPAWHNNPLSE